MTDEEDTYLIYIFKNIFEKVLNKQKIFKKLENAPSNQLQLTLTRSLISKNQHFHFLKVNKYMKYNYILMREFSKRVECL